MTDTDVVLARARSHAERLHQDLRELEPLLSEWCRDSIRLLTADAEHIARRLRNVGRVHAETTIPR